MIALAFLWVLFSPAPAASQTTALSCRDWHECRQLALDAAERRDYETFHDLAWRTVQLGPRQDPSLLFMLARAQCLSGRPHDALVMLRRIADTGVAADALTSDDFRRSRDLPDWPEVQAQIERRPPPARVSAAAAPPPARAEAAAAAAAPPVREAAPPVPPPAPGVRAAVDQSVRLAASTRFAAGGLAYDAVSHRFVVGDVHGRKLLVVSEGADHAVDLVRAESAGFQDIRAVEIDGRRGDLWVVSTAGGDWTLHRMQLVSGRPLKAIHPAPDDGPLNLVDLAVTSAGAVLAIDSAGGRLLVLRPNGSSLETLARLTVEGAASVTATGDEDVAYVAHNAGIVRVDRRSKAIVKVASPAGVNVGGVERLRWHRNALIAIQRGDDGARRVVKFSLGRSGRAIVTATVLDMTLPPAAGPMFATVAGDELSYLILDGNQGANEATSAGGGQVQFVIRRLRLP